MYITLEKATQLLNNNDIVALPTETVYGLAAAFDSEIAVKKVFTTKNRPLNHPLILHVSSISMAKKYVENWSIIHETLATQFWPGPLTILTEKSSLVSDLITAGSSKVALRIPNHPLFLSVIDKIDRPLVAPSANPHQKTSPTTAEHVEQLFSGKVAVLDGDTCEVGLESTILEIMNLDPLTLFIARPGFINAKDIENILIEKLNLKPNWTNSSKANAPGSQKIHYQPSYPLISTNRLNHPEIIKYQNENICKIVTVDDDADAVFKNIYSILHKLKNNVKNESIILNITKLSTNNPRWLAVIDRLSKASIFTCF